MKYDLLTSSVLSKKTIYILLFLFVGLCGYYIYQQYTPQQENYTNEEVYVLQNMKILMVSILTLLLLFFSVSNGSNTYLLLFMYVLSIGVTVFIQIIVARCWRSGIFLDENTLFFTTIVWLSLILLMIIFFQNRRIFQSLSFSKIGQGNFQSESKVIQASV